MFQKRVAWRGLLTCRVRSHTGGDLRAKCRLRSHYSWENRRVILELEKFELVITSFILWFLFKIFHLRTFLFVHFQQISKKSTKIYVTWKGTAKECIEMSKNKKAFILHKFNNVSCGICEENRVTVQFFPALETNEKLE